MNDPIKLNQKMVYKCFFIVSDIGTVCGGEHNEGSK